MRATTILRFPEESRLYTGSIFRPLLDTKTRIGSQGYVLSDGMVSSSFFSHATCHFGTNAEVYSRELQYCAVV